MRTEYAGPSYRAALIEARQLPWRTLLFRLRWELARRAGLHHSKYEPSNLSNSDVLAMFPLARPAPAALLDYFRSRDGVHFLFDRSSLPAIRRVWGARLPAARATLVARADRICRHEFDFLGSQVNVFPGEIDWHCEMNGKGRWPERHWSKIDIRSDARLGDVKHVWELNRTQFFVTLARAFVLTGDERYARELCQQMRSWLAQNPSEIGVNWYSNLEVALRATSWIVALEMTLQWDGWDPELFTSVIRCLIDHQRHLLQDIVYSEHCMATNHLLGDAMGIVALGLYLPEIADSQASVVRAVNILVREAERQVLPDGVSFEMAIGYHRFVFYMYLLVERLLARNGRPVPDLVVSRLERMAEFAMHARAPSGAVCQIGDWDNGKTLILDDSEHDDFTSMLCSAAVRFKRGDLKAAAGEFREEALWLFGPDAATVFDSLETPAKVATDGDFRDGGHFFRRSDWTRDAEYLAFKCAPFLSHTHADNLSLLYSAKGVDWLVDRGTFTYNGAWDWRTYFRGTRAHNAVSVDGLGQALAHRCFRWLRPSTVRVLASGGDRRLAFGAGAVKGFPHVSGGVVHGRWYLLVRNEYLVVVDALRAEGRHHFELYWHLAPGLAVERLDEGGVMARHPAGAALLVRTIGTGRPCMRVAIGEQDPIQGWHSKAYGDKEPAPTVVHSMDETGTAVYATLIRAAEGDEQSDQWTLHFESIDDSLGVIGLRVSGLRCNDRMAVANPCSSGAGGADWHTGWWERDGARVTLSAGAHASGIE